MNCFIAPYCRMWSYIYKENGKGKKKRFCIYVYELIYECDYLIKYELSGLKLYFWDNSNTTVIINKS